MVVFDESLLLRAYRAKIKAIADVRILAEQRKIAWFNHDLDPPAVRSTPGPQPLWMQEQLVIIDETKAASDLIGSLGEVHYEVATPRGRGTEDADALAKLIAEALQSGQSLIGNGLTIVLEHTERRPYRQHQQHPAWVLKPVASRWRTFTSAALT